jgi:hypothetical protein
MKIELTNAAEAGMPETMIGHCRELVARRLRQLFPGLPEPGADFEILYSEKDPLMEKAEPDDEAYFLYFSVASVEGDVPENAVVAVDLMI